MVEDIQDPKNLCAPTHTHTQHDNTVYVTIPKQTHDTRHTQTPNTHDTHTHTCAHTLLTTVSPFLVVFVTFLNTVLAGCPVDLRVDLRQELFDNGFTTELLESASLPVCRRAYPFFVVLCCVVCLLQRGWLYESASV